jgi:hypothetical protein
MAEYIEAPNEDRWRSLFLAGGITDTVDWQSVVYQFLQDLDIVILNPRRSSFDLSKREESVRQIEWEYRQLRKSDECLFYFPETSICPITLFELGSQLGMAGKRIFVGTHPEYSRRMDIEIQTSLIRPEIKVASGLSELIDQVRQYYESQAWITKQRAT